MMDFDIVFDFDLSDSMMDLDSFDLQNHGNHLVCMIKV